MTTFITRKQLDQEHIEAMSVLKGMKRRRIRYERIKAIKTVAKYWIDRIF